MPDPTGNLFYDVPAGAVLGSTELNKFGRATNVDAVATDIWDRANATDDQDVWTAPTTARKHDIVSASANDDVGGSGAETIRIYGLKAWTGREVNEDIRMNGTSSVATSNSYVIIHRMKVLTSGGTTINAGNITATAQTDSTVTAQINAGEGQTQMAIWGIGSQEVFFLTDYYAAINTAGGSADCDVRLKVNAEPDSQLTEFITRHQIGLLNGGSSYVRHKFEPYNRIDGPAIVKVEVTGGAINMDVSAGFDGFKVKDSYVQDIRSRE